MTNVNNPITDALDEMLERKAKHMILQTNDHPQFLVHGEQKVSDIPLMTSEEIIEDCLALGMTRKLMEDCHFFYSPDEANESHVFKITLTGRKEDFFLGVTLTQTVSNDDDEEWGEF